MLFNIWEVLINLCEPILLFIILYKKLTVRSKCMPLAILGIPLMAAVTTYLNFNKIEYLPTVFIATAEYALYAFLVFKGKAGHKILWCCLMILTIIIANTLTTVPIWVITASTITLKPGVERIVATSLYVMLDVLFVWIILHIDEKKRNLPLYIILPIVALCLLGCLSLYSTIDVAAVLVNNNFNVQKISTVAVIIVIFIVALILLLDAISRAMKKVEAANLEIASMNAEVEHDEQIRSMVDTFREIKHDYVGHMLTIASYAKKNDIEGINAYLEEFSSEYGVGEAFVTTGNHVFDSILTAKTLLCRKSGIEIKVAAIVPQETPFTEVELSSIFNNLLDNAIEAQEKVVGDKYISVDFKMKDVMVYIDVINSSSGNYIIQDGKLKTSKPDARVHGLGLKRVERMVKSHGGTITISPNSDTFEVYIVAPMF